MSQAEPLCLLDALFATPAMAATFSDPARVQGLLDFEAALARVQERLGLIPPGSAEAISRCCVAEHFAPSSLYQALHDSGNLAIPLVGALTAAVAREAPQASRWVHFGVTSQDAIDTGAVLQWRRALALLDQGLSGLVAALRTATQTYRDTPMPGRTLLQQAVPISFGLKTAGWLGTSHRSRERLRRLAPGVLQLQLGGAAGTLGALGRNGPAVFLALAEELGLTAPALPWHSQRDRVAELGSALGLLIGGLGKIGRDLSLLMQSEVGEVLEPAAVGRGGSSAMPQKHNPVASVVAQSAALRAPGLVATLFASLMQEHERAVGGWHAEWETLPELFRLAAGSLEAMTRTVEALEVRPERMRAQLDASAGQIYAEQVSIALIPALGREAAQQWVAQASRRALSSGVSLHQALAAEPAVMAQLGPEALGVLFDPHRALGAAQWFIDRALLEYPE